MFKLYVMTIQPNANGMNDSSTYLPDSLNIWHVRLGHDNFDTLRLLL